MKFPRRCALLVATALGLAACTSGGMVGADPETASPQAPAALVVELDGTTSSDLALQASRAVWAASPVAVVTDPAVAGNADAAIAKAKELAVPLFAVPAAQADGGQSAQASPTEGAADLPSELQRLGVDAVLAIGEIPADSVGDIKVVSDQGELPKFDQGAPVTGTVALSAPKATTKAAEIAQGSLAAAGVTALELANRDPRQRAADVEAMANADAEHFIAVGAGFGPLERLTTRVNSAVTGVQLPGGGQTVFYDKRYVALYGHPLTGALGVLGEQPPAESVKRVEKVAQPYQQFTADQVIPAFEIIATVAAGSAGKDGNYSTEWDPDALRPLVEQAKEHGIYVVLDLQSGMSTFPEQAKLYEELLKEPHVGLALDPEWKLKPGQKPLAQFGSVDAKEINKTSKWLAKLTRDNNLPQKMFLLHQFRLDMITNKDQIDMTHDELAYVSQMDGTGSYSAKTATWNAVTAASPADMLWGWKNFYDEDQPTMTPQQTYQDVHPKPVWVSYQ